jgi:transcriptional regulator with XRE-family HTH domain
LDDHRLGLAFRAIRIRRGWRQVDLAIRARASQNMVSRIERGHGGRIPVDVLRRIASALDARLDILLRWQGADLDRLMNAAHSSMHESVAKMLKEIDGWTFAPEVSFAIYGERGIIDVLAWHARTRTTLVIELKTQIVDVQELIGKMDQRRRLARRIAGERGWDPATVAVWILVAQSRTARRHLAAHVHTLRAAFPDDGRSVQGWLKQPGSSFACLSFLPDNHPGVLKRSRAAVKRVRRKVECSNREVSRTTRSS